MYFRWKRLLVYWSVCLVFSLAACSKTDTTDTTDPTDTTDVVDSEPDTGEEDGDFRD